MDDAIASGEPLKIRAATLAYLRTHRDWYAESSERYTRAWNALTFLIIVLGSLTASLNAYGLPEAFKPLLVFLPLLSSICGALLLQYRMVDIWRLRESGRISAEELICRALKIPHDDPVKAIAEAVDIRIAAHKLERDQLNEFFSDNNAKPKVADA
jgi:hypothetical protein